MQQQRLAAKSASDLRSLFDSPELKPPSPDEELLQRAKSLEAPEMSKPKIVIFCYLCGARADGHDWSYDCNNYKIMATEASYSQRRLEKQALGFWQGR